MHRSRQSQQLCLLLFLPVLIGVSTTVLAVRWEASKFGGFGGSVLPFPYPMTYALPIISPVLASQPSMSGEYPRPCKPLVLSGCSDKWEYCGCEAPALNVSAIPQNAVSIDLGALDFSVDFCTPSCLLDTFTPLPHRPNVSRVQLTNIWAAPDNRPFPVAAYLDNLKATLKELELYRMYLPTITQDTFAGFVGLRELVLLFSHVSTIDINAFTALGDRPRSAFPQLNFLSIGHNNFTTLDWSVFEPLMGSVKSIYLVNDNIQRIVVSHFYEVHGLETVDFTYNTNLTDMDDRFLRSVSPVSGRPRLGLSVTPLCSDATYCRRITKIHGPLEYCCRDKQLGAGRATIPWDYN
ncbi:uncharacterized protein LOC129583048 [Paramacrobiotus metropolitanus]|uniref:uncharacterized protein LOC129583048 n=1 Tax=Paramacrobiotus metropolitanus TaxID=2943436 RepID=UPI00244564F7|nr:uncharacterized protein LOC129583048 [Paramacrobiotus metropolitanus]